MIIDFFISKYKLKLEEIKRVFPSVCKMFKEAKFIGDGTVLLQKILFQIC